jgi:hypothetical protein
MSSTVSPNEEISPAQWLEARFEDGYRSGLYSIREVIELHDDHGDSCYFCERDYAAVTDDGFWWRPPSDDAAEWYAEIAIEADDCLIDQWLGSDAPMPTPAAAFMRGPEYPTGELVSHSEGRYHSLSVPVTRT